jgi:hypothetical protein
MEIYNGAKLMDKVGPGWQQVLDIFLELVAWDMTYNSMPKVEITSLVDRNNKFKIEFNGGDMQTVAYARLANIVANLQEEESNPWRTNVDSF